MMSAQRLPLATHILLLAKPALHGHECALEHLSARVCPYRKSSTQARQWRAGHRRGLAERRALRAKIGKAEADKWGL